MFVLYSIGVDIGGMNIKVGIVNVDGVILQQCRKPTDKTPNECINNIIQQINYLLQNNNLTTKDIRGIGIGCPGAVSSDKGLVDFLPNLGWYNVPLVKILSEAFSVPVAIANDASVAVLAEATFGVAKNYNNCLMLTLGTGVGGGIVIGKKLYDGGFGRGGELGHITLDLNGEPCSCGRRGCVETFVSATALIKQTKKAMNDNNNSVMWQDCEGDIDNVSGKTAFECAKKGDKSAQKVVDNYVKYLSESMMSLLNVFRPEVFILGGGISLQGEYLTDKITEYCEKFNYGYKSAPKTRILCASLGNDAGIIGASLIV